MTAIMAGLILLSSFREMGKAVDCILLVFFSSAAITVWAFCELMRDFGKVSLVEGRMMRHHWKLLGERLLKKQALTHHLHL